MLKTDSLHELIKGLNPAEKRYFKVTCQGGNSKPNNYILLFNALEQMKVYDEPALLKKFKGTNFINHLPSEKNYLYDLVLKTMRGYNSSRTKANELHNHLQDIQFLFDKGHYEVCLKRIRKAKKIAYDFDRYGELLDLLHWQRKLIKYTHKSALIQQTNDLIVERNQVTLILQNENSFLTAYEKYFLLLIERNGKDISKSEALELSTNPLLLSIDNALSFKAKTFYFLCQGFRSLLLKDLPASIKNFRQGISLWQTKPERISEEPDRYKSLLQNYVTYAIGYSSSSDIVEILQTLKTLPTVSLKEAAHDFQRIYLQELYFYINEADFINAAKAVKENAENLLKYEDLIDTAGLLSLYFNIASTFFLSHDFDKCIKWLQKINLLKADVREDIRHFALLMELIIHIETTPTVAESIYNSTYRHLTKYANPNKFELTLLKCLKRMITLAGTENDEVIRMLKKLQHDLQLLETLEEKFIGMEELACWIEAKLRRLPMHSILKEKVKLRKEHMMAE